MPPPSRSRRRSGRPGAPSSISSPTPTRPASTPSTLRWTRRCAPRSRRYLRREACDGRSISISSSCTGVPTPSCRSRKASSSAVRFARAAPSTSPSWAGSATPGPRTTGKASPGRRSRGIPPTRRGSWPSSRTSWSDAGKVLDTGPAPSATIRLHCLGRIRDMRDEPRGLTLEPDRCSRHSVGIHASPAEIYHALTDPHELSRWFVSEASIDLRPGGSYRWVFGEGTGAAGPDALVTSGEFVAIVPQEYLRLSTPVEGTETLLEFRLDPWRDGDGRPPIKGRYVVWDPDRFLVMTFEAERPSVVRLWLEEAEDGTMTDLSLEHRLFAPDPKSLAPFDWEGAIEKLAAAKRTPSAP